MKEFWGGRGCVTATNGITMGPVHQLGPVPFYFITELKRRDFFCVFELYLQAHLLAYKPPLTRGLMQGGARSPRSISLGKGHKSM